MITANRSEPSIRSVGVVVKRTLSSSGKRSATLRVLQATRGSQMSTPSTLRAPASAVSAERKPRPEPTSSTSLPRKSGFSPSLSHSWCARDRPNSNWASTSKFSWS